MSIILRILAQVPSDFIVNKEVPAKLYNQNGDDDDDDHNWWC